MAAASEALDRFSNWMTRLGDAWESGSAADLAGLFVVGATFQPTPFADLVRGRRAIVDWFADELERWTGASFAAQVLGVGDTYGVAHLRVGSSSRALDGVLVAALDGRGRCTALRLWRHESAHGDIPAS
jgi:hypothetical protein